MRPPLPVPPPEFMFLATAGRDADVFLRTGEVDRAHVGAAIEQWQAGPSNGRLRVLDWGCGCGRIARHWVDLRNVELYGCDVAEDPVRWCQENLQFAQFAVSRHDPPLPYPDAFFDVVYAASVLTHLMLGSQFRWMQELWRVLRPGGIAMLTTHGPSLLPMSLPSLSPDRTKVTLIDEEIFICLDGEVGSNSAGAIQTRGMTERIFRPFAMLDYRPRFGFMGIHDTNVFRKQSDGEVIIRDDVATLPIEGHSFQASMEVDLRGARSLCLLVGTTALTSPTQITARVGDRVSAPAPLGTMVQWTSLVGAYSSLVVTNLPMQPGRTTVDVDVTSVKPLDGHVLQVPKIIGF
jgi:SAM-dependent methyltransferase